MGDTMLHGVLRLPPELWRDDELDRAQRYRRYLQASQRIEDDEAEIDQLRRQIARSEKDAARYAARRKAVFLTSVRTQVSRQQTEAEFNAEYDASCDKNIAGFVSSNEGWVKDISMKLDDDSSQQAPS